MSGYRPPYSTEEQKTILMYIIKKDGFYRLRGNQFWKELEESGKTERTWQSLKEHFRRHLYKSMHEPQYQLTPHQLQQIRIGYNTTDMSNAARFTRTNRSLNLEEVVDSD